MCVSSAVWQFWTRGGKGWCDTRGHAQKTDCNRIAHEIYDPEPQGTKNPLLHEVRTLRRKRIKVSEGWLKWRRQIGRFSGGAFSRWEVPYHLPDLHNPSGKVFGVMGLAPKAMRVELSWPSKVKRGFSQEMTV